MLKSCYVLLTMLIENCIIRDQIRDQTDFDVFSLDTKKPKPL